MSGLGEKPNLRWIAKNALVVDRAYQREISSRRGQALIEKLKAGWSWLHCAALVVAPTRRGKFVIIDGQHRHQAALKIASISVLPCLVVKVDSVQQQAAAFIAHNRDRVTLNFLALFHADVAAGDKTTLGVLKACKEAGITVLRSPKSVAVMEPTETMAVGVMGRLLRTDGHAHLVTVLKTVQAAYDDTEGQLRANVIAAASAVLKAGIAPRRVETELAKTTAEEMDRAGRAARQGAQSLVGVIAEQLAQSCGTTTIKPKGKRGRPPKTPFTFDRSKAAAPKAEAVEIRGDVKVRRFEPGTSTRMVEEALKAMGLKMKGTGGGNYKVGKINAGGRGQTMRLAQVMKLVDDHRKEKGLPPITSARAA